MHARATPLLLLPVVAGIACGGGPGSAQVPAVVALAETEPVRSKGDAADDPALWIHPTHPARSLVIGTDKKSGLSLYTLEGAERQYVPAGALNNVDVRYGLRLGSERVDVAVAVDKRTNRIFVFSVSEEHGLVDRTAHPLTVGIAAYGTCLYQSADGGYTDVVVTSKSGAVEQWRLRDAGRGRFAADRLRSFEVGSAVEGCVADDALGHLFLAEEEVGIWRYPADPAQGDARVSIDAVGEGRLVADVEGLALYQRPGGAGYLIASSQGNSTFVVYERAPAHAHRLTFRIGDGPGVDGASETDGVEATSRPLGPRYPNGLVVVQDGENPGAHQNFKLVPWHAIERWIVSD